MICCSCESKEVFFFSLTSVNPELKLFATPSNVTSKLSFPSTHLAELSNKATLTQNKYFI